MANKKNEQAEVIEASKGEKFAQDNWKLISYIALAVVLVFGGYFGWKQYSENKNAEAIASAEYADANFLFDSQQWAAAAESFDAVIDLYGSTAAGNISKAKAGLCQKNLGNYAEAVSYLKQYSGSDNVIAPAMYSALGDCQVALEDYSAASASYEKAAKLAGNNEFSPIFIKKAGLCYEKLGDNAKALKAYQTIKNDYPASDLATAIDKAIIRVQ